MLEAYLFIDPLCNHCIRSEKDFLKLAKNLNNKFLYQFIPVLSIQMQHHDNEYYKANNLTEAQEFRLNYYAVLDYYAALFQGKRIGRKFLLVLQKRLLKENYSDTLVLDIAKNIGLDLDMFEEDRRSDLAKRSFEHDQNLVHEMNIKKTSSAVIFDCNSDNDGIRFESFNYHDLYNACQNFSNDKMFKNGLGGYRIPNLSNIKLNL